MNKASQCPIDGSCYRSRGRDVRRSSSDDVTRLDLASDADDDEDGAW